MHPLEVKGIADGEVAQGIVGQDPVTSGQLTNEEIKRCEANSALYLNLTEKAKRHSDSKKKKTTRYTPIARRQDKPDAVSWLLRNCPEMSDLQITKLIGTTKATITGIKSKSHWNMQNIRPRDPVLLGLCTQVELDKALVNIMSVVTRFAPSPTGYLHIGGARTALFNYLFSRHHQGKFLLRIEDTDRARSTKEAVDAIINGLGWLGLGFDDEIIYQFARANRHAEIAKDLIAKGKAYYCYTSQEELAIAREDKNVRFTSVWRDKDPSLAPKDTKPVVRLKAPQHGDTIINDLIQGSVTISNSQADDMVLLRSDGTPTYMLAVVVDDHDMGITHIIRGDDHLNNAARQMHIYHAMGWQIPKFAHIPLIHGADGAKLSKRHGALGIESYRDMGYLPEALRNYLLRLGWSHGNEEMISIEQAIKWFDLSAVGKSPSRMDFKKLENVNQHYIKETSDKILADKVIPFIDQPIDDISKNRLIKAMKGLKPRAKNLVELADNSLIYLTDFKVEPSQQAIDILPKVESLLTGEIITQLKEQNNWSEEALQLLFKNYCDLKQIKLGDLAQIFRIKLTGSTISPSIFDIMSVLGREETLKRVNRGE
jgi:glutamyl-tRNA synthetase